MITKLQVKYIQSLGQKKFRDETNEFIAEGPKIINELLTAKHIDPVAIYATPEWIKEQSASPVKPPADKLHELKASELERISFLNAPQGVLGIFKKPQPPLAINLRNNIVLMLDAIQDPGNMGSIIRIADWFGVHQLICSKDCADAFAPKVVQATMGSIARVSLDYTDLEAFATGHEGITFYAATLSGKPLHTIGKIKQGVIIIGNESKGVSESLLKIVQEEITIPRIGKAESLNAAVATGIILSHLVGQS